MRDYERRSTPLAASRTYYPGFFGALFLVLLRVSIGWHFLYEGVEKLESRWKGGKPFSAEAYLRYSTGPLAPYFRGLLPDVNSLAKLDPARIKATWKADVERIADHYGFNADQRAKANEELVRSEAWADVWAQDKGITETRNKYYHDLAEVQKVERHFGALQSRRDWASSKRKDLDADRRGLVKDVDARAGALLEAVALLRTKEQAEAAGPYVAPMTYLDFINLSTTYGLIVMGSCLILGLFTRLSALAGVVFLAQIYLSMPPWPGLPVNPLAEGHYMIVSKNLVEMIALLSLMCLPTGHWVGLDALLFGWYRRSREFRAEERARRARERERSRQHHAMT